MLKIAGNRKMIAVLAVLLVTVFFASGQAFAWTWTAGFEGGILGTSAQPHSSDGWDYGPSPYNIFNNTNVHSGSQSSRLYFPAGFETTIGCISEGSGFGDGHELWYRAYFYFPTGWSWGNYAGKSWDIIKMMRIWNDPSSGNLLGVLADNTGQIVVGSEPAVYQANTGYYWDVGKWQCMEFYVKLGQNNNGILRVWKNGVLVLQVTNITTQLPGTRTGANHQLFGNWNDGSPVDQYAWADDVIMTDVTPSQVDSKGNPMIGPTDWSTTGGKTASATPPAPTNLRVN